MFHSLNSVSANVSWIEKSPESMQSLVLISLFINHVLFVEISELCAACDVRVRYMFAANKFAKWNRRHCTACESTVCGAKLNVLVYVCMVVRCVLNVWAKWFVSWWRRWWWWLWQLLKYFCISIQLNCVFPIPLWESTNVWLACRVQWNYQGHNRRHSCALFRQFNAFAWCTHTHIHTSTENTSLGLLSVKWANNHRYNTQTHAYCISYKHLTPK